jgi:hypothetical protein
MDGGRERKEKGRERKLLLLSPSPTTGNYGNVTRAQMIYAPVKNATSSSS